MSLENLLAEVRACRVCAAHLPLGPRPVLRAKATARLLIIGQAPGTKVHASGVPWDDRSGERLRDWLQISPETFYDESQVAIVPMGFCYPGVNAKGGDLPPRPECAPLWHEKLLAELPAIGLTLLVGQYAQARYLGPLGGKSVTENVANYQAHLGRGFLPLPHPSWRTVGWQKKNQWFDDALLPALRRAVAGLVA